MPDAREIIIGIDLGTTNSLVAYCDEKGPRILPDAQGRSLLPSVVRFDEATGQPVAVGHEARRHAVEFPHTTVFSIKRLMGRGIHDVTGELAYLPYEVVQGEHDTARVKVGPRVVSPQEVSAIILRRLREQAESALGQPVSKAVITVPAYFDDAQRQATRDAGRLAGLRVVRIVNEPTAAALAYGLGLREGQGGGVGPGSGVWGPEEEEKAKKQADGSVRLSAKFNPAACTEPAPGPSPLDPRPQTPDPSSSTVAVFDLGGGTFDVSILSLHHTEAGAVDQVLATAGDTHLGGDDVDRMIVELIQSEVRRQFGDDTTFPPATRQALRNLAEATKIKLSTDDTARIEIELPAAPAPGAPQASSLEPQAPPLRTYSRTLTRSEFEAMITPWATRTIDACRQALRAARLQPADIDRVIMVGGSTRIPLVRRLVAEFFRSEPYTALNPDEVVALGAAVQASVLAGVNRDMLLLDVIPLSLGIETMGGAVAKLIMANTTIPARATEMFSTYIDGQANVKIHVLQGERELVRDCRSLGQFDLRGIPPMPAGLPKIEVTFLVDANGILSVTAVEKRSEKAASIQVVPNHGLTREEVARIESESFAHAKEDMTAHRLIDLRNQARLDIRQIRKQLDKVGGAVDDAYRAQVQALVAQVEAFLSAEQPDADAFARALTEMDHATVPLAEAAIKQTLSEEA